MYSIAFFLALAVVLLSWGGLLSLYFVCILRRGVMRWKELEDWRDIAGWAALLTFQLSLAGGNGLLLYVAVGVGLLDGSF